MQELYKLNCMVKLTEQSSLSKFASYSTCENSLYARGNTTFAMKNKRTNRKTSQMHYKGNHKRFLDRHFIQFTAKHFLKSVAAIWREEMQV